MRPRALSRRATRDAAPASLPEAPRNPTAPTRTEAA